MLKVQSMCQVQSINVQILPHLIYLISPKSISAKCNACRQLCHLLLKSLTAEGKKLFASLVVLDWMLLYLLPDFMRQTKPWDGWEGPLTILGTVWMLYKSRRQSNFPVDFTELYNIATIPTLFKRNQIYLQ